jgi:hypothetical protein
MDYMVKLTGKFLKYLVANSYAEFLTVQNICGLCKEHLPLIVSSFVYNIFNVFYV